jgi:hypothetical protein
MDKALLSDFTPLWDPCAIISASNLDTKDRGLLSTHLYGLTNHAEPATLFSLADCAGEISWHIFPVVILCSVFSSSPASCRCGYTKQLNIVSLFPFFFGPFELEAMKCLQIHYSHNSHNKRDQKHELPVGW